MKILAEIINNSSLCSDKHDTRYYTLMPLLHEMKKRGHDVIALYKSGIPDDQKIFPKYELDMQNSIDFYIGHAVYGQSKARYNFFRFNKKIPVLAYEAGWLYNSLLVDRYKLFADSYYFNKLGGLIEEGFDETLAHEFRLDLLNKKLSKWRQPSTQSIPKCNYIFIPGQVLHDISIEGYSETGLIPFIEKVTKFATKKKLHVIYKPHPGLTDKCKPHGKKELLKFSQNMCRKYDNFHIVDTSIYDLMQKSVFTACVNAGSMVDNMATQTPVYCCGKSVFVNTGAIYFNENVEKGLQYMLDKQYDLKTMKLQQLKVLYWLKNNLIQEHLGVEENFRRLERHSGVKF